MEQNKDKIRTFLSRYFQHRDLPDDEDIFATGSVNSLFAMQLVLFVESEFSIKIEDADLKIENFSTINALANLIERKTVSSAPA